MDKTQKLDQELKKSVIDKRKAETQLIKLKIKKEKIEIQEIPVILDSLVEQNAELIEKTLNQSAELAFAKDESLKHKKYALELEEKLEEAIQEGMKLKQSESELKNKLDQRIKTSVGDDIFKTTMDLKDEKINKLSSEISEKDKYLKEKTADFQVQIALIETAALDAREKTFKAIKCLKTTVFIQSMLLIGSAGYICYLLLK